MTTKLDRDLAAYHIMKNVPGIEVREAEAVVDALIDLGWEPVNVDVTGPVPEMKGIDVPVAPLFPGHPLPNGRKFYVGDVHGSVSAETTTLHPKDMPAFTHRTWVGGTVPNES